MIPLYLSRLTLNPEHGQARRDLAGPYDLHRTLARAFGDAPEGHHRAHHGILFRVEDPSSGGVPVLVQSTSVPRWEHLEPGYLARLDGPKTFEPAFVEGQQLRFRLIANPVRRVNAEGKRHPRREALVHPRAKDGIPTGYLDWLDRQLARYGAEAAEVADVPFRIDRKRKAGKSRLPKDRIPHFGVRFDGTLTVTDPERLAGAVAEGIGAAKAFGFGLLSVARV
ncbi:MAG: type I-E CRISPR-associated protein Cas6/Cse3/CasE [Bacteroidota bacterium]